MSSRKTLLQADSAANGLAEGAVREVKAKLRVVRFDTEEQLGGRLPDGHSSLPWMTAWACTTFNLGRAGPVGRTPYELRYGRRWRRRLNVPYSQV